MASQFSCFCLLDLWNVSHVSQKQTKKTTKLFNYHQFEVNYLLIKTYHTVVIFNSLITTAFCDIM